MTKAYIKHTVDNVPPQIVDLAYWGTIRYDPDDLQPNYLGLHLDSSANTSDTNWKVYKYTYTGTNVMMIQLAYGAWYNRTSLF